MPTIPHVHDRPAEGYVLELGKFDSGISLDVDASGPGSTGHRAGFVQEGTGFCTVFKFYPQEKDCPINY